MGLGPGNSVSPRDMGSWDSGEWQDQHFYINDISCLLHTSLHGNFHVVYSAATSKNYNNLVATSFDQYDV